MEYHVVVEKMCGCAKHEFEAISVDDNFVIAMSEGELLDLFKMKDIL